MAKGEAAHDEGCALMNGRINNGIEPVTLEIDTDDGR